MSRTGIWLARVRGASPRPGRAAKQLLYQYGVGLAFLATVRADGGPRVHPFCPVIDGDGLYAFIVPSPKRDDLHRDGRYAMHSFPADENEDAFCVTGTARIRRQGASPDRLEARSGDERPSHASTRSEDQDLFEFRIERCLITRTTGHGDPSPPARRMDGMSAGSGLDAAEIEPG